MKDRHFQVEKDNLLLKEINRQVQEYMQNISKSKALFLSIKFVFYFGLQLIGYLLLYQVQSPILFILIFMLYGIISILFAFNFAHDFSHNTVFEHKKWNEWSFIFIYTLTGAHAESWKYRHIHSHHFAPNVKDYDSDLKITSLIRVEPDSEYKWFHRFQHYYAPFLYTTYSLFWIFVKDFVLYFCDKEYPKHKTIAYHLSFWVQKTAYISYILVFPLFFSWQSWQTILLAFLLMHLVQSLFLLFTFFMTHHVEDMNYPTTDKEGNITTSWMMNQVLSSNDFYPFSFWANFIFGGFNNHIAHHLFPHIHHSYYPQLNCILYKILQENAIKPHNTTYWGGVVSHLRYLKKMGKTC